MKEAVVEGQSALARHLCPRINAFAYATSRPYVQILSNLITYHLPSPVAIMAGKKGENTKKVAGNQKKAEAAAQKQAVENQKKAAAEDEDWGRGAKSNAKK